MAWTSRIQSNAASLEEHLIFVAAHTWDTHGKYAAIWQYELLASRTWSTSVCSKASITCRIVYVTWKELRPIIICHALEMSGKSHLACNRIRSHRSDRQDTEIRLCCIGDPYPMAFYPEINRKANFIRINVPEMQVRENRDQSTQSITISHSFEHVANQFYAIRCNAVISFQWRRNV